MRYPAREVFIANTDRAWFDFLFGRAVGGRVDEVNFWLPRATSPMKSMLPGELMFFRLKKPDYRIAGYGFFAHPRRRRHRGEARRLGANGSGLCRGRPAHGLVGVRLEKR